MNDIKSGVVLKNIYIYILDKTLQCHKGHFSPFKDESDYRMEGVNEDRINGKFLING